MYHFCYIESDKKQSVKYIKSTYCIDVNAAMTANETVICYQHMFNKIKFVESAFEDFKLFANVAETSTLANDIAIERKARAFFLEFGIYLSHWEKYISTHRKRKEFKVLFDQVTKSAFDNSDEYALASMLRNYITHNSDVVHANFRGVGHYDVGCLKNELLSDKSFTERKRSIIKRQSAQFISLASIMTGALERLKEINTQLLKFDYENDEEKIASVEVISKIIDYIKSAKLENKNWCFVNDLRRPLASCTPDNKLIEVVWPIESQNFEWRKYEEIFTFLNVKKLVSFLCYSN